MKTLSYISCVGDKFTKEHFPLAVQSIDEDVHHAVHLGLECECFARTIAFLSNGTQK